jgi:hypothetical protein
MFEKDTICHYCAEALLPFEKFQNLFVDEDLEGGILLTTTWERLQKSPNCSICSLILDCLIHGNIRNGSQIAVRLYAVALRGRPSHDISLLYLEANTSTQSAYRSYTVYTDHNDPASTYLSTLKPNPAVNSAEAFDRATFWLNSCNRGHDCYHQSSPLPTRVLQISSDGKVNLYVSKGERVLYVTLSYCWGAPQPQKTTSINLQNYVESIDVSTLPRTISDAIEVVRKLGVRYLWVDALCIIQDSDDDKAKELSNMRNVYRNSYLTLLVAGAERADVGFLDRDHLGDSDKWKLPYVYQDGIGSMTIRPWKSENDYDPEMNPAFKRAWIFQEWLLSPRLLIYPYSPHPVQWECSRYKGVDGGEIPMHEGTGFERLPLYFFETNSNIEETKLWKLWTQLLQNYTSLGLSVSEDKFPAISGVAREFSRHWSGSYYCGVWSNWFVNGLLWRVFPVTPGEKAKPLTYRAPSWSWASVDVKVVHCLTLTRGEPFNFQVLDCAVQNIPPSDRFLQVRSAQLKVRGCLKKALWTGRNRQLIDQKPTEDLYIGQGHPDDEEYIMESRQVWCLQVIEPAKFPDYMMIGLLLREIETDVYERVGAFTLILKTWFQNCQMRDVILV